MKIVISLLVLFIVGCNPQKRLYKAVSELNKHPIESAKYCADKYPVKDTVIYKDSVTLDTIFVGDVYYDTVETKDTVYITKTLPGKTITKTITQMKEVLRENTARVEEFKLKYLSCEGKYQALFLDYEKAIKEGFEYKKQRNKMRLWLGILIAAIGVYTVLKFKKILPF